MLRNYLDRGLSRYMGALSKAQRLSGPGLRAALFQNACTIRAAAEKSFAAAPIGVSLWLEYRKRNPDGLMAPPVDLQDCTDLELLPHVVHIDSCDDRDEFRKT